MEISVTRAVRLLRSAAWMVLLPAMSVGSPGEEEKPVPARPFFAFDNGLTDIKTPAKQAALLKELGYDGICTRPPHASEALFEAIDREGLKVWVSYVTIPAGEKAGIPKGIVDHIAKLKGRGTIIWLGITTRNATDEAAVGKIREVCDLASASGLQVVLYPHTGFCTDTVRKCARLVGKAERENLGLSFSLCHFLMQNEAKDLEATIRLAAPHLKLVQLNGADEAPPRTVNWDRLIQPLGEGSFDVGRVIRCLDEIGYRGPVNLQCYKIAKPAREHLATSMRAWKTLTSKEQKP